MNADTGVAAARVLLGRSERPDAVLCAFCAIALAPSTRRGPWNLRFLARSPSSPRPAMACPHTTARDAPYHDAGRRQVVGSAEREGRDVRRQLILAHRRPSGFAQERTIGA